MKTIKQIADELGVSKQKVYRFIVRNHITASSEVKQSKLYDEATEMLIKQGILEDEPYQKSHHEAHQNHINDTVSEAVIELLRKELEQKNEQLQEKDRQIREKDQQISEMQAQLWIRVPVPQEARVTPSVRAASVRWMPVSGPSTSEAWTGIDEKIQRPQSKELANNFLNFIKCPPFTF